MIDDEGLSGTTRTLAPSAGNSPGWRAPILLLFLGACLVLVGAVALRGDGHGLTRVTSWLEPGPGQPTGATGPDHPGSSVVASLRVAPDRAFPDPLLRTGPDVHVLELGAVDGRLALTLIGPGFERQSVDLGPQGASESRDVVIAVRGGEDTISIDTDGVRTVWRPLPLGTPQLSLEGLTVGPASGRVGPVRIDFEERPGTGLPAGILMVIGALVLCAGVGLTLLRLRARPRTWTPRPTQVGIALILSGIAVGAIGAGGEPPAEPILATSAAGVATSPTTLLSQPLSTVLPAWVAPVRSLDAVLEMDVSSNESSTQLVLSGCEPGRSTCPDELTVGLAGARPTISVPVEGQPTVLVIGPEFTPGPHEIGLRITSGRDLLVTLDGALFKQVRWAQPIALPGEGMVMTVGQDAGPADPTRYVLAAAVSSEAAAGLDSALDTWAWWGCLLLVGAGMAALGSLLARRAVPVAVAGEARTLIVTVAAVVAAGWSLALVWGLTRPEAALSEAAGILVRNSPFFTGDYRFSDFFQPFYYATSGDPYGLVGSNYPPFGNILLAPLHALPTRAALAVFLGLAAGAILGIVTVALRTSEGRRGLLPGAIIAMNFPLLFAVDRGNIDLAVIGLVLVASLCMPLRRGLAGLAIGIAVAIKLFPVVLLAPLMRSRRWPLALLGFGSGFVGLSALALPITGVDSSAELRTAFLSAAAASTDAATAASYGTSIRSGLLALGLFAPGAAQDVDAIIGSPWWTPVALSTAFGLLLWSFAIERRPWRAWAIASIAALALPPISGVYHAAILLAPLVVLARMRDRAPWPRLVGVLLGLVLAPTALWHAGSTQVSTSSVLVPFALLVLVLSLVGQGLLDVALLPEPALTRHLRLGVLGVSTGLAVALVTAVVGVGPTAVAHVSGESEGTPVRVALPAEMCPDGALPAGITVSGSFTWGGRDYASVFSTAPANAGLRMEITPDGSAGILVPGWVVPQGLYLAHRIRIGEPTPFSASFDGGSMSLTVRDETVSMAVQDYDPACRCLSSGSGFSDERDFDGPVRLTMVRTEHPGPGVRVLFLFGWVLSALSALVAVTALISRLRATPGSIHDPGGTGTSPVSGPSAGALLETGPPQSATTKLPTSTLSMQTEFDVPTERA